MKKFGGTINDWCREDVDIPGIKEMYEPNLGCIIRGTLGVDPTGRGFGGYPIQTSLVVRFNPDKTVETLNTIYQLGIPLGG